MKRGRKEAIKTHCKKCGVELTSINHFYNNGRLASSCRECCLTSKKEYYKRTYDSDTFRKWNLKSKYGITQEEYNYLYELQQFGCAICRMPIDKPHIDHNHETGEVRGLLCIKCNVIVGHIENNEDLVLDCIEYLKRTTWKKEVA